MSDLLSRLRSYFFYVPLVYLYTAIMGTGSLLSSLFDRDGHKQHWFARTWSKMILSTASCPIEIIHPEKLNVGGPAVYVVNHLSAFDIPTLYAALPFQFRIMAKKELFRYPVLGWHLKRSGQIPIERENARSSLKSLIRASEALKNGMSMVVFPEGGRSPDGHLQPFLGGSFYVAIKAQTPIVPMALIGTFEALPMNSFHIKPRPFQLVIGDAISTAGYAPREMDKLAALAESAVSELYYSRSQFTRPAQAAPDEALRHRQLHGVRRGPMNTKPRIAIPEPHSSRDYTGKRLRDYTACIETAGGEAVVIPLELTPAEQAHLIKSCDAVMLPGSPADVDPEKYDEPRNPHTAAADVPRDNADELLLQDAYNMRKPVFGICYGVQSLNVWRTGKLTQHIKSKIAHEVKHEARAHTVILEANTILARLSERKESELWVNSSHHQSLSVLGDGLRLAATSPQDGVVEAVEGTAPDQWVLGVQWHPERTFADDTFSRAIFEEFINQAKRWHEQFAARRNDFEAVR